MIPATLGSELSAALARIHLTHVVAPTDPAAVIARGLLSALTRVVPPPGGEILASIEASAERVSTTFPTPFGVVIVLSQGAVADPVEYAATIAHEHQHAAQIHARGGVGAAVDYLGSGELRARAEADAYAVGVAVRWMLTGQLPTLDQALAPEASGLYHLSAGDLELARGVLASHLETMHAGLLPPLSVAREVHAWLASAHPEALAVVVSP